MRRTHITSRFPYDGRLEHVRHVSDSGCTLTVSLCMAVCTCYRSLLMEVWYSDIRRCRALMRSTRNTAKGNACGISHQSTDISLCSRKHHRIQVWHRGPAHGLIVPPTQPWQDASKTSNQQQVTTQTHHLLRISVVVCYKEKQTLNNIS